MNSAVGDIWRMYMDKSLAGFNGLFTIEWDTRHITVMDRWVVVRAGLTYRLSKLQFYYICFKIFLFLDNLITSVNSESIPQAHTQAFSGEVTWFCWSSARPCTTQQGQQLWWLTSGVTLSFCNMKFYHVLTIDKEVSVNSSLIHI